MANEPVYQSTDNNPIVTWTYNGQSQSAPLDQAPPEVRLEYQKLPQASAQTSTAQSGAESAAANAQLNQNKADQLQALKNAGSYFSSHPMDKNSNWVSPQIYNQFKKNYTNLGGDAATFDNTYEANYVSPNNVMYDTPDAKSVRGAFPLIKQVIDSYYKLGGARETFAPELGALGSIPYLGEYLQQRFLSPELAHNRFLTGMTGQIRQIAGAGENQGFRFNLNELNNIANLLPNAYDSKSTVNKNLDEINGLLENKFGTDLKTILKGNY